LLGCGFGDLAPIATALSKRARRRTRCGPLTCFVVNDLADHGSDCSTTESASARTIGRSYLAWRRRDGIDPGFILCPDEALRLIGRLLVTILSSRGIDDVLGPVGQINAEQRGGH
jgi:hypothetical protein